MPGSRGRSRVCGFVTVRSDPDSIGQAGLNLERRLLKCWTREGRVAQTILPAEAIPGTADVLVGSFSKLGLKDAPLWR